jgi:hypothetical protein
MRHVVSESEVAHLWASQAQDSARVACGNFYFDGAVIYSYGRHFPIAKHVTNSNGEKAVLFTTSSYSNTTAKHIHAVRHACNHLNLIYCKDPECGSYHTNNFQPWISRIEAEASHLPNARKPEMYLNAIEQISAEVRKYVEFFSVPIPATLQTAMDITSKDIFAGYSAKKNEAAKIQRAKAEKEAKKRHNEGLKKWLSGEAYSLYDRNGRDYLRIKDGRVQTSQHVELPIEMGKRLYQAILDNTLKVGDKVLSYEVNEVGKDYRIGCHTFPRKYLLEFGSKL